MAEVTSRNVTDQFPSGKIKVPSGLFANLVETNPRVLEQRQKQIEYGKNTQGYKNFISVVDESLREQTLRTPNIYQKCSKRSFDGQVREWRRGLHAWDTLKEPESLDHIFS